MTVLEESGHDDFDDGDTIATQIRIAAEIVVDRGDDRFGDGGPQIDEVACAVYNAVHGNGWDHVNNDEKRQWLVAAVVAMISLDRLRQDAQQPG